MSAQKRVLVVEDEIMIAMHIEETLAPLGYEVRTASTTQEAERIIASEPIDLAILDYHLQDATSAGLAARLQARGIAFAICSGTAGIDELGEVFKRSTFLSKPFTTDGLIDVVQAMTVPGAPASSRDA